MARDLSDFFAQHKKSLSRYMSLTGSIVEKYESIDETNELDSVLNITNCHVIKDKPGIFRKYMHGADKTFLKYKSQGKENSEETYNTGNQGKRTRSPGFVYTDVEEFDDTFQLLKDVSSDVASFLEELSDEEEPSDAETLGSSDSYETINSDYEDSCDLNLNSEIGTEDGNSQVASQSNSQEDSQDDSSTGSGENMAGHDIQHDNKHDSKQPHSGKRGETYTVQTSLEIGQNRPAKKQLFDKYGRHTTAKKMTYSERGQHLQKREKREVNNNCMTYGAGREKEVFKEVAQMFRHNSPRKDSLERPKSVTELFNEMKENFDPIRERDDTASGNKNHVTMLKLVNGNDRSGRRNSEIQGNTNNSNKIRRIPTQFTPFNQLNDSERCPETFMQGNAKYQSGLKNGFSDIRKTDTDMGFETRKLTPRSMGSKSPHVEREKVQMTRQSCIDFPETSKSRSDHVETVQMKFSSPQHLRLTPRSQKSDLSPSQRKPRNMNLSEDLLRNISSKEQHPNSQSKNTCDEFFSSPHSVNMSKNVINSPHSTNMRENVINMNNEFVNTTANFRHNRIEKYDEYVNTPLSGNLRQNIPNKIQNLLNTPQSMQSPTKLQTSPFYIKQAKETLMRGTNMADKISTSVNDTKQDSGISTMYEDNSVDMEGLDKLTVKNLLKFDKEMNENLIVTMDVSMNSSSMQQKTEESVDKVEKWLFTVKEPQKKSELRPKFNKSLDVTFNGPANTQTTVLEENLQVNDCMNEVDSGQLNMQYCRPKYTSREKHRSGQTNKENDTFPSDQPIYRHHKSPTQKQQELNSNRSADKFGRQNCHAHNERNSNYECYGKHGQTAHNRVERFEGDSQQMLIMQKDERSPRANKFKSRHLEYEEEEINKQNSPLRFKKGLNSHNQYSIKNNVDLSSDRFDSKFTNAKSKTSGHIKDLNAEKSLKSPGRNLQEINLKQIDGIEDEAGNVYRLETVQGDGRIRLKIRRNLPKPNQSEWLTAHDVADEMRKSRENLSQDGRPRYRSQNKRTLEDDGYENDELLDYIDDDVTEKYSAGNLVVPTPPKARKLSPRIHMSNQQRPCENRYSTINQKKQIEHREFFEKKENKHSRHYSSENHRETDNEDIYGKHISKVNHYEDHAHHRKFLPSENQSFGSPRERQKESRDRNLVSGKTDQLRYGHANFAHAEVNTYEHRVPSYSDEKHEGLDRKERLKGPILTQRMTDENELVEDYYIDFETRHTSGNGNMERQGGYNRRENNRQSCNMKSPTLHKNRIRNGVEDSFSSRQRGGNNDEDYLHQRQELQDSKSECRTPTIERSKRISEKRDEFSPSTSMSKLRLNTPRSRNTDEQRKKDVESPKRWHEFHFGDSNQAYHKSEIEVPTMGTNTKNSDAYKDYYNKLTDEKNKSEKPTTESKTLDNEQKKVSKENLYSGGRRKSPRGDRPDYDMTDSVNSTNIHLLERSISDLLSGERRPHERRRSGNRSFNDWEHFDSGRNESSLNRSKGKQRNSSGFVSIENICGMPRQLRVQMRASGESNSPHESPKMSFDETVYIDERKKDKLYKQIDSVSTIASVETEKGNVFDLAESVPRNQQVEPLMTSEKYSPKFDRPKMRKDLFASKPNVNGDNIGKERTKTHPGQTHPGHTCDDFKMPIGPPMTVKSVSAKSIVPVGGYKFSSFQQANIKQAEISRLSTRERLKSELSHKSKCKPHLPSEYMQSTPVKPGTKFSMDVSMSTIMGFDDQRSENEDLYLC